MKNLIIIGGGEHANVVAEAAGEEWNAIANIIVVVLAALRSAPAIVEHITPTTLPG